jgi:hypothetical protein
LWPYHNPTTVGVAVGVAGVVVAAVAVAVAGVVFVVVSWDN